jgi:hypothetical protein
MVIGRNSKGEVVFASNVAGEKWERLQPMPAWRERQARDFMRDMPEPVWWGAAIRPSVWVLAFLAFGLVCYEWGAISAAACWGLR